MRRVFIVGGKNTRYLGNRHPDFINKKHPDFGTKENPILKDYIQEAIKDTLKSTKVDGKLIDTAYIGNFAGELFSNQGHLGAAISSADPGLKYVPASRLEGACASGGLAVRHAFDTLRSGSADISLVVGAETQNTVSARQGGDFLARASDYDRQRNIDDFTFPALLAQRKKAYREKYPNVTDEDFGKVTLKAFENGNKNPLAHMHHVKTNLDKIVNSPNFLSNETLKPHVKLMECSQVSDGASAMIVANEEGLKKLGLTPDQCTEILTIEVSTGDIYSDPEDYTNMDVTAHNAKKAFKTTGLTAKDMGVAEVHDCFTIAEILHSEALGFANAGEGAYIDSGINGEIPINCGGGLTSFGHPVGATGVKQFVEVSNILSGTNAQEYYPEQQKTYGITSNMGGDDRTSVISIMRAPTERL
mmetsp:Transcript_13754/g.20837  ORF Transcript_13754/g.20837 Transcript_13754/m.20837 type:complete len:417 (+) Transcript_13754:42-1292(+)